MLFTGFWTRFAGDNRSIMPNHAFYRCTTQFTKMLCCFLSTFFMFFSGSRKIIQAHDVDVNKAWLHHDSSCVLQHRIFANGWTGKLTWMNKHHKFTSPTAIALLTHKREVLLLKQMRLVWSFGHLWLTLKVLDRKRCNNVIWNYCGFIILKYAAFSTVM